MSSSAASHRAHVDDLVTAVLTASRVLVAVAATSLAGTEGTVTLAQFRMLVMLDSNGETNLNGLAESLGVNASTALRMVERLVAAGLVTRHDNMRNRREVVIALSQPGAELVWRVTDRRRAEIARIVRQMPTDQRGALVTALNAFADAAGEPHATGSAGFGW
jgi:DNA-binding MarR family transcriptional regulator